jgi:tripartite-type tricarboxylate transporter receptor subunit TctC
LRACRRAGVGQRRQLLSTKLRRLLYAGFSVFYIAASEGALAQAYPVKSIRLIVPFAAGSTADIAARYTAERLSNVLSQPIVVENKAGAGGTIATAALARAAPDGYTIGVATQGTLVFNQGIYAKPGYNSLKDFAPIALLGRAADVMVVHPRNVASSPNEIVAVAKSQPGTLTFASGGTGTSHHLAGVLFGRVTRIDIVHVPYRNAEQGVLAVMTNDVAMGFFNIPLVIGHIKRGELKALGVTSLQRSSLLPDVPTLDEQGIKGYEVNAWGGYVAPAGTPAAIVAKLNQEMNKIFESAETKQRLGSLGFELSAPLTPDAFRQVIADDSARWVPLVKASGAKAD